jgi:hypothetical protein
VTVLTGAVLMASGALAACSGDDSSGKDGVTLEPVDDGPAPEDPGAASLSGSWEGTFDCGNGPTGLTLTIDDRGSGRVAANFAYHPVDAALEPTTPRYSMEGDVTAGQLSLTGREWIQQDDAGSQAMMGVQAEVADRPDPEHLEGTLDGEGCSSFAVDRTSTEPWYVGSFQGKYGCNQGITGLTLTVEDGGDAAVDATYDFYAVPENPDVPSGSYRMEGTYNQGEMVLHGTEWVEQPEGYIMVDLRIQSDLGIDPQRLYGIVGATGGGESGCSLFSLDRVAE